MKVGYRVRVTQTAEMCCGVLMQGYEDVIDCVMPAWNPSTKKESKVAILRNGSLHWVDDLERI